MRYIENLRFFIENLIKEDEKIYLIGEDIAEPYGGAFKVTKGLSIKYPNKFIQTPMSEQGFTGMAIGMSLDGLKPIVEIMFGDFITLVADQLINHISKFNQIYNKKLNFVLRTPSGGYRGYGATHSQSLETIYLSIPGIYVISPSILNYPGILLEKSINFGNPVLFIENKLDYSREIIENDQYNDLIIIEKFENNKWPIARTNIIDETPEITLLTYGGMTSVLLEIQEYLFIEEEIPIEVISISNINHIDYKNLEYIISTNKILTIEESWEKFGWGSYILSRLLKNNKFNKWDSIGAKAYFIPAARTLEEHVLPNKQQIIDKVYKMVGA